MVKNVCIHITHPSKDFFYLFVIYNSHKKVAFSKMTGADDRKDAAGLVRKVKKNIFKKNQTKVVPIFFYYHHLL